MQQLALVLGVRAWKPKDAKPGEEPKYFMEYAVKSQRRAGMESVNASVNETVFNKLLKPAPCWAELQLGIGGAYQGKADLVITDVNVVATIPQPQPAGAKA